MQEYNTTRTDRFPATPNEMPGLIMTHVPSDLSRRTASNFSETPHTHTGTSINSSARQPFNAPQMTISAATHPTSSATGPYHGGAACTMMSASSSSRIVRPAERLRLREWLRKMIETQAIQGLHWIDKERQIVKIPWKHAARHGWSRDKDACLFRAWAIHTKKYDPATDCPKANPKVWKANFRCAINSLPDIEELREKGKTKGNDAYKVYRLHPKKSKRQSRDAEGANKVIKRQRSTSKTRGGNKTEKKQRKRNSLIIPSAESLKAEHPSVTRLSNASDELAEDLLNKRIAEIRASKSDRMSLNVKCVFNPPNGLSSTVSSHALLSPMSPPSTLQSPTTPYSMPTNGHHFASPNAYSSTMTHSTCVSPCSTVASTPASTPQSPPPPYQVVMNNRQEMQYRLGFNMEARFEMSHQNQMGYESYHDDLSDSDSCGRMSEEEVANLVMELKDQSPGHSSRSMSPLDGNNNLDATMDYSSCWSNQRQHQDEKAFFGGNNYQTMAMTNNRVMAGDVNGYEQTPMMTHIKVEPETHHSMQAAPQHQNHMLNGFAQQTSICLNAQHQGAYADPTNYLLHQL
ncbi:uncharacterized protein LOC115918232 isoform X2 [Strongylocentrotus purpuratus]|uniref:IRF tryptophan pentad repeat domain-containing protein n=1 Tax=Strongylocentrotus purpuratus TaxID=7668 RepID=A0A7M7NGH3_STRPU|nr:uncharacterized protein LOC115918232 isoform X2 [Strongylocentrotus purpuratus]